MMSFVAILALSIMIYAFLSNLIFSLSSIFISLTWCIFLKISALFSLFLTQVYSLHLHSAGDPTVSLWEGLFHMHTFQHLAGS